jgi:hypothetical protein
MEDLIEAVEAGGSVHFQDFFVDFVQGKNSTAASVASCVLDHWKTFGESSKAEVHILAAMTPSGCYDAGILLEAVRHKLPPGVYCCKNLVQKLTRETLKRTNTNTEPKTSAKRRKLAAPAQAASQTPAPASDSLALVDLVDPSRSTTRDLHRTAYALRAEILDRDPSAALPSPLAPDFLVQLRLVRSKQNGRAGSFERSMTADLLAVVFDQLFACGGLQALRLAQVSQLFRSAVLKWRKLHPKELASSLVYKFFAYTDPSKTTLLAVFPELRPRLDEFQAKSYHHAKFNRTCLSFPLKPLSEKLAELYDVESLTTKFRSGLHVHQQANQKAFERRSRAMLYEYGYANDIYRRW